MLRQAAARTTDLACQAVGRRPVVRAARFVLLRARLDVLNDMTTNGEPDLQRWVIGLAEPGAPVRVIDVGANVGGWSAALLGAARQAGRLADLELHAFEPSADTYRRMTAALDGRRVATFRAGLSDRVGAATLHVAGPGAGINSLHRPDGQAGLGTEQVPVTTLDEHAREHGLDAIALVKIDTEGHDLAVLRGARDLLAGQRIGVVQFEYNCRWIYARSFLRDAFELLEPCGYRIGKLTPRGVEFYPGWDADLETFVEGNYIAATAGMAAQLPAVSWWKPAVPARTTRASPGSPRSRSGAAGCC
jgi:FkbM family methyltransferase